MELGGRMDALEMLAETLRITEEGKYTLRGKEIFLKESRDAHRKAVVITQEEAKELCQKKVIREKGRPGSTIFTVSNRDSFEAALDMMDSWDWKCQKEPGRVLVLNFANPVNPGGGVRRGARAQEEDLCRRSTLLASLESEEAEAYYKGHRKLAHRMATDAMILSPVVEVFRDREGFLMEEAATVSVVTCAAPMANALSGAEREGLAELFAGRIQALLHAACRYGYEYLVLGAWGCGAFGNDAGMVSQQFARAFREFRVPVADAQGNVREEGTDFCFRRVEFAVLDRSLEKYRYQCFLHAFPPEANESLLKKREENARRLLGERRLRARFEDAIRGSLVGGGAGDALGYPVEFWSEKEIRSSYGKEGITSYDCPLEEGLAVVSDDTQMTMFTATGVLQNLTKKRMGKDAGPLRRDVYRHYLDWLYTQDRKRKKEGESWLLELPELFARRAPGTTCMSALLSGECGTCEDPINHSKGCGGIMRVAPVALCGDLVRLLSGQGEGLVLTLEQMKALDQLGADTAAVTHGHPLGYIPAAALVHIVHRIVYGGCTLGEDLYDITAECRMVMEQMYGENPYFGKFRKLLDEAVERSRNEVSDSENIRALGEGWTGDEAFAIALYCSLRHQGDFSGTLTAAVNHNGDSDSTGAIAGNIVGAMTGYERIDIKWKNRLELRRRLLELADDLCFGCELWEDGVCYDEEWVKKYGQPQRSAF